MKIPNINANSIKNFFLYNVEKVILGISLVLLGVLFYLGMSSTKYDKTPDGLVSETKNAASFINRTSNWELISDYRKGDTQVPDRISQASAPVDSSGFKIAGLSMIPKALQLRADPPLPTVIDLEAGVIRATIAVRLDDRNDFSDPLLELPQAIRQVDPDAEEKKGARAMSMEDEMMMGMEEMADAMEGMTSGVRPKKKKKKREKDKDPQLTAEPDGWHGLPGVQEAMGGLRPKNIGVSSGNSMALKRNVVVVNALVEHRKLWKQQEQVLSNAVAWYPKRDLPQYEFLQVEKRTIGADGKPSAWEDVSEWINYDQSEWNPGSFISGPEVVAPENFDPNLTNAIPALMGVDYASYVLHSKLTPRVFKKKEVEDKEPAALDALSGKKKTEEEENHRFDNFRNGGRREKGSLVKSNGGGMMGMDMGMMDMSGMDGMDGMGMMGMFGPRGDGRTSMDMTAYSDLTDPSLEPESDYKAVRFFDMRVSPAKPMKYEYRVRLWLKDPNATDPEADRGGFSDMGMNDGMEMMGGMGGRRRGKKKDEKKIFQKTDINFTMQDQLVRDRLKLSREEEDENGDPIFYVSEFYDGQDKPTEVQVPIGFDYLRFTRPTKWSEPVAVSVGGASPQFFVDTVESPRTAKVGNSEIPVEEAKVSMVTELENPDLSGIDMAGKKEFSIGDLMNFSEPITIMHPVAQSVHFLEEASFVTGAALVDVMGGERLNLPKGEPIQYSLPGESLVMGSDGQFRVTNDIEQRRMARHALRTPDEKAEYGKRKRKKKVKSPFGMGGDFGDER